MRQKWWQKAAWIASGGVVFQATGTCSPEVLNSIQAVLVPAVNSALEDALLGDSDQQVGIPAGDSVFNTITDRVDQIHSGFNFPEAPAQ